MERCASTADELLSSGLASEDFTVAVNFDDDNDDLECVILVKFDITFAMWRFVVLVPPIPKIRAELLYNVRK